MTAGSIVLAVPGTLTERTGGYIYDLHVADGLRRRGWIVEVLELDRSFPFPTTAALEHAADAFACIPSSATVVIDSLAFGAMPDVIAAHAPRLAIVGLLHLPLSATPGLDADVAARFAANERRAYGIATLVVATGQAALPLIAPYGLPSERVVVIEPGVERAPVARGSGDRTVSLLSVANINPGKGHERLIEALSTLRHLDWRLTCAGSLTRSPETAQRLRDAIARHGLADRVALLGELDQQALAVCYDSADVFVLATLRETFGMAVAEALARGLPVVATTTGAIPEMVGDAAGLLVPPGDTAALAAALARVISEPDLRERLGQGARGVRDRLPSWEHTADRFAAALQSVAVDG